MSIPAKKVKALCTDSEAALVRASRKGELESLSPAQLKQHSLRARKLADKWRDLERSQSRARSRQDAESESAENTRLKAQIFRDAQTALEARLAKLPAASKGAGATKKRVTKQRRAASHRATRAAVRKGLAKK